MVVPPKHPKMIIFSRKTHGCWVPPFKETSRYDMAKILFKYRRCNIWSSYLGKLYERHMTLPEKGGEILQFSQKCTHTSFQYLVRLKKLRLSIHGLLSNLLANMLSFKVTLSNCFLRFCCPNISAGNGPFCKAVDRRHDRVFAHWNWLKIQRHGLYGGFLKWWYPKMDGL